MRKPPTSVWVVQVTHGSYSDRQERQLGFYYTKAEAEAHAKAANEANAGRAAKWTEDYDISDVPPNPWDPAETYVYADAEYYAYKLTLLDGKPSTTPGGGGK